MNARNHRATVHNAAVSEVQRQVRLFYAQKKKVKIYHGSTNSTRSLKYKRDEVVDISPLRRVMEVNTTEKYVVVEPNVPMDALVKETMRYDLVPAVVMEFPGITVGGGIQGGALESSSFKKGMFHDACLEYEVVVADGTVVTASPTEHADLFHGLPGSYGSLGIITLVKLRLVPAKRFVRLSYDTVACFDEALGALEKKTAAPVEFIDAIMFSRDRGTVMSGTFSEEKGLPIITFHKATDDWFYLHAEKIAEEFGHYEELIPTEDYFFRYDRGSFWMGKYAFTLFKIPFNRLTRFIANGICKTRRLYRSLHAANLSQYYIIQDLSLPKSALLPFLHYVDETLQIYPIWLLPVRPGEKDKLSPNNITTDLVVNVGVWGGGDRNFSYFLDANRKLERLVASQGGRKILYAHSYYPRDEFWKIYDETWYNGLREKYDAGAIFPDIYEKIFVGEEYAPSIPTGVWNLLKISS